MSARDGERPATAAELDALWRWGLRPRARAWERGTALLVGAGLLGLGLPMAVEILRAGLIEAVSNEASGVGPWASRAARGVAGLALGFAAAAVVGTGISRNLGPVRSRGRGDPAPGAREAGPLVGVGVALAGALAFALLAAGLVASAARAVDATEFGLRTLTQAWAWRLALGGAVVMAVAGAAQRLAARGVLARLGPWLRRQGPGAARR